MYFGVNLSGETRIVRKGTSTSTAKVGTLAHGECFTFRFLTPAQVAGYDWWSIEFLGPNGWTEGYYRGTSGFSFWKNKPSFKSGNKSYYKVTHNNTPIYTGSGYHLSSLNAGDYVFVTNDNDAGVSGQSHHDWMYFTGIRLQNGEEEWMNNLTVGANCERTPHGFIETNIDKNSHSPWVRGQW